MSEVSSKDKDKEAGKQSKKKEIIALIEAGDYAAVGSRFGEGRQVHIAPLPTI